MSKLWEVDPETRSKLLIIQKSKGNDRCCDCGAPSPQWASPKFGTFICLNCAGTHRGLGVHISFVRSITMDAFKLAETQRMEHGGNEAWRTFFDEHESNVAEGRTFEDSTIKERYDGDVGEEWKARLTAKVEGREYVPGEEKTATASATPSRSSTSTPLEASRSRSPVKQDLSGAGAGAGPGSRKERNEAYFARLGAENASRADNLPPSQGGKYGGFGGGMPAGPPSSKGSSGGGGVPGVDEFQNDPMAALTKGFGWFTTTIGKGAKTVNDSYLQPAAKQLAESDFAAQARVAAAGATRNLQTGVRGATDSFNRFVEGPSETNSSSAARGRFEPERKDFWDSFSSLGDNQRRARSGTGSGAGSGAGAIGTATMKKTTSGTSGGSLGGSGAGKEKDEWDDNW